MKRDSGHLEWQATETVSRTPTPRSVSHVTCSFLKFTTLNLFRFYITWVYRLPHVVEDKIIKDSNGIYSTV